MYDKVELVIGNKIIDRFISYSIDAQLYNAASSFTVEVSPSITGIALGDVCRLRVNNQDCLYGVLESISKTGSKEGKSLRLGGRDCMGQVVSRYLESFDTITQKSLVDLARSLLSKIPYVKDKEIIFTQAALKADIPQQFIQPDPGQTVFDLLHSIAVARGINFYCRSDGSMVFDRPKGRGEVNYQINNAKDISNVISYSSTEDITDRYSKIIVVGQRQDDGKMAADTLNQKAIVSDSTFPYDKPFVCSTMTDAQTPKHQARMILEQQRFNGSQIKYTVAGHAQYGVAWQTDELVAVYDEELGIREILLIYGRTFTLNKNGARTELTLGKPGVLQ